VIGLLLSFAAHPVAAQTTSPSKTSFSYQGQLLNSGTPVNATCSFQFTLYDAATGGTAIGTGTAQTVDNLEVKDSYFSTQLDFGATAFDGSVRYVAVGVKCPPDTAYTPMTSRVALTSAPTSLVAQQALAAPWSGLTGIPANLTFLNSPTSCTAGQVAKWNATTNAWACGDASAGTDTLASLGPNCTAGQVAKWNATTNAWACGDASAGTTFTTAADSGLTLTNSALSVNFATSGSTNGTATTAARSDHTHALTAIDGVPIGATTAAAGKFTTLEAASLKVGSPTTGQVLTSDASGNATWATLQQAATSSGWGLTGNASTDPATNFIGTTDEKALEFKVNGTRALRLEPAATNTDAPNIIGGFSGNTVTSGVKGATIGGGGAADNLNVVTDDYGTVAGGSKNQAGDNTGTTSDKGSATVGGGYQNKASGLQATVGGGVNNAASGIYATVSGGANNAASGQNATVGGGYQNAASGGSSTVGGGDQNAASGQNATVGGGQNNAASGDSATVGGGQNNEASDEAATVGGGQWNKASGTLATVGGGAANTASGNGATVGGGRNNAASGDSATVGGGQNNAASGQNATVGGGYQNAASGSSATVPGGIGAKAALSGQMAYANGYFRTAGDAQTSVYVLRNTTTNGDPTELYLDGSSAQLTIDSGRAYFFDVQVVGATSGGSSFAGYIMKGAIENNAGTMYLNNSMPEQYGPATWVVATTIDNTNKALVVKVTGAAGTEIRWVATVRTTEVGFPAP